MKDRIAIIHYQPIEYYPPVSNMINYISSREDIIGLVFSTHNNKAINPFKNAKITFIRVSSSEKFKYNFIRLLSYIWFNVTVFIGLIKFNPRYIIYYESYSAMPVFWYLRLFGRNKKVWIHSHEYFDKDWYKKGMKTIRLNHKLESTYLFKKATGLSHTNQFRVNMFLQDNPIISSEKVHVIPNYPPLKWRFESMPKINNSLPIRIIYVGTLSINSFYISEFLNWILTCKEKVSFDIYSQNITKDVLDYIHSLNSSNIHVYPNGINYYDLPHLLRKYQIGIILHKCTSANFIYNETNKLFEYLSQGLDVWFSKDTIGIHKHINTIAHPKVIPLDYTHMSEYTLENLISVKDPIPKPYNSYCEPIYMDLLDILI